MVACLRQLDRARGPALVVLAAWTISMGFVLRIRLDLHPIFQTQNLLRTVYLYDKLAAPSTIRQRQGLSKEGFQLV